MIYSMSDLTLGHYSAIRPHTLMYVFSPYNYDKLMLQWNNNVPCLLLLMPRDYYIKINLFKYLSVMNQPLDHFVDKSVNQSIKNL